MYDVSVIGGGPHGLRAAQVAALNDASVAVFEEDREIGLPRHCTGLLSINAAKMIGAPAWRSALNRLRGVVLRGFGGEWIKVLFPRPVTLVLDRVKYDRFMAEAALNAGAEIFTRHRVVAARSTSGGVKIRVLTPQGERLVKSRYAILASGPYGNVHVPGYRRPGGLLPASQILLRPSRVVESDLAQIVLSRNSKGFFAWVVPTNRSRVLVGIATGKGNAYKSLLRVIAGLGLGGHVLASYHGIVVTGGPIKRLVYGRIMAVGDAAGHVKATTGGGLFYGYICATLAGIYSKSGDLKKYEEECRRAVHGALHRLRIVRRVVNLVPYPLLDRVVGSLRSVPLSSMASPADQDAQWKLLRKVVRNPMFYLSLLGAGGR